MGGSCRLLNKCLFAGQAGDAEAADQEHSSAAEAPKTPRDQAGEKSPSVKSSPGKRTALLYTNDSPLTAKQSGHAKKRSARIHTLRRGDWDRVLAGCCMMQCLVIMHSSKSYAVRKSRQSEKSAFLAQVCHPISEGLSSAKPTSRRRPLRERGMCPCSPRPG